ncbi:DUF305 domain-containing protein [Ornithinimicrobium sp. INDO-MA30-4]|uniref:DUF305 domain-containing protein n=1 Tax=Ornithinimicrobium sp. INDO-MA30-4 TaxID=2908651 RepID=UPI001F1F3628|nr:DUF305 domain-containing protein [Ornithinimicrobium sp. INDO-MA30-4]UJH71437.1 DUF305 domain-containing protein [Ornithinimicrobium sp. INDO-MA30-4]
MKINRNFPLPALVLAGALALSACGGGDSESMTNDTSSEQTSQEAATTFNDADVEFASQMIPHHKQAVMMSELAFDRGGPEVVELAEQIRDAQSPEIETMTQWLSDWGVDEPMSMNMDDMGSGGMMGPDDMQSLMGAQGQEFDTAWLEMMIVHHEGAITMSQAEQENGASQEAIDLAGEIIEAQQAEITQMEGMLE